MNYLMKGNHIVRTYPFYCDAAYYQQIEKSLGIDYIKNMNLSKELEDELVKQSLI